MKNWHQVCSLYDHLDCVTPGTWVCLYTCALEVAIKRGWSHAKMMKDPNAASFGSFPEIMGHMRDVCPACDLSLDCDVLGAAMIECVLNHNTDHNK